MARVILPGLLRDRSDGAGELVVDGSTAAHVLRQLETRYPALRGWVLDERGRLREHVKLFVNDAEAFLDTRVAAGDELHIVPAISGGSPTDPGQADREAELLVGTRKGLFVLRGRRGGPMRIVARKFPGEAVEYAIRDPRTGTCYASVTNLQFGPHLFIAGDPAGGWEEADGPAFPGGTDAAASQIWAIEPGVEDDVLWAGVAPAALFRSSDRGRTWELNHPLWDEPTRPKWEGGLGGLCLHSVCPWPGDADRLAVGISAAGVWLSEDGGRSWRRGVRGLVSRYLPEEARADTLSFCIHNMKRAAREPTTLYMQFHGGLYRSDDAGESWIDIGTDRGVPSDFGFPLALDPTDPNRAFVIPLVADVDRVTPDGRVRVYETRDRGKSWSALGDGLPDEHAYLTVLRQAFGTDGANPLGLYFGATSGELFGSADGGASWSTIASRLPPILSVRASL